MFVNPCSVFILALGLSSCQNDDTDPKDEYEIVYANNFETEDDLSDLVLNGAYIVDEPAPEGQLHSFSLILNGFLMKDIVSSILPFHLMVMNISYLSTVKYKME